MLKWVLIVTVVLLAGAFLLPIMLSTGKKVAQQAKQMWRQR